HHGGLWAARRIHDEERDELRSMPRGVQDAETKLPKLQLLPIAERAKRIGRARRFVQAQLRAMRGRKSARSGDMVRVDVRVDDVAEPELTPAQQRFVRFGVAGRVNDRRLMRLARGDQVGGAPALFVENLLEIHDRPSSLPPGAATEDKPVLSLFLAK